MHRRNMLLVLPCMSLRAGLRGAMYRFASGETDIERDTRLAIDAEVIPRDATSFCRQRASTSRDDVSGCRVRQRCAFVSVLRVFSNRTRQCFLLGARTCCMDMPSRVAQLCCTWANVSGLIRVRLGSVRRYRWPAATRCATARTQGTAPTRLTIAAAPSTTAGTASGCRAAPAGTSAVTARTSTPR